MFAKGVFKFCGDFYVPPPTGGRAVRRSFVSLRCAPGRSPLARHVTCKFVESTVIPCKAGIQTKGFYINSLDSRFRGNDGVFGTFQSSCFYGRLQYKRGDHTIASGRKSLLTLLQILLQFRHLTRSFRSAPFYGVCTNFQPVLGNSNTFSFYGSTTLGARRRTRRRNTGLGYLLFPHAPLPGTDFGYFAAPRQAR